MTEREGTARLEPGQVGRGEHAQHAPVRLDDDDVVGARVEHLDDRVDGDALRADLHRRLDDPRNGVLRRHPAGDDALAQDGVREDREVLAVANEDRRAVLVGHRLRGPADRDAALAENGRAGDQLGDPDRSELRHRMHDMTGLHEAPPQRRRQAGDARRPREQLERLLARDEQAARSPRGPGR